MRRELSPASGFVADMIAHGNTIFRRKIKNPSDASKTSALISLTDHAKGMYEKGIVPGYIASLYRATLRAAMMLLEAATEIDETRIQYAWTRIVSYLKSHQGKVVDKTCLDQLYGLPLTFQIHLLQSILHRLQKETPGSDAYRKQAFGFALAMVYLDVPGMLKNISTLHLQPSFLIDPSLNPISIMEHWFGKSHSQWMDTAFSSWFDAWQTYLASIHGNGAPPLDATAFIFDIGTRDVAPECTEYHQWYASMCVQWKLQRPLFSDEFTHYHEGIPGRLAGAFRCAPERLNNSPKWDGALDNTKWTTATSICIEDEAVRHADPFEYVFLRPISSSASMCMDNLNVASSNPTMGLLGLLGLASQRPIAIEIDQCARFFNAMMQARRRVDTRWNRLPLDPHTTVLYGVAIFLNPADRSDDDTTLFTSSPMWAFYLFRAFMAILPKVLTLSDQDAMMDAICHVWDTLQPVPDAEWTPREEKGAVYDNNPEAGFWWRLCTQRLTRNA